MTIREIKIQEYLNKVKILELKSLEQTKVELILQGSLEKLYKK